MQCFHFQTEKYDVTCPYESVNRLSHITHGELPLDALRGLELPNNYRAMMGEHIFCICSSRVNTPQQGYKYEWQELLCRRSGIMCNVSRPGWLAGWFENGFACILTAWCANHDRAIPPPLIHTPPQPWRPFPRPASDCISFDSLPCRNYTTKIPSPPCSIRDLAGRFEVYYHGHILPTW